jgi:tol-pal system protein YbgF
MGVFAPEMVFAQSKEEGQLTVRVQQLEDQVRTLNGQIEGLQFTLTQMQQQLQKMSDDNEFRFQQLEGGNAKAGAGKKTSAATPTGGETPAGALPQPAPGNQTTAPAVAATEPPAAPSAAPPIDQSRLPPADIGSDSAATDGSMDSDTVGESADPLVGKGGGTAELGTIPGDGVSQPLNLSLDASQELSNGDAEAQYKAGYDAIVRGDYTFAEEQFRQFIALYPKDPQAPDATNWLGEALLQRQAYDDAADVLLTGFQNYEKSPRAPDLLMKLAVALAGAGEGDTACRTFAEVSKRYPKQPAAFTQRLQQERAKAQCPA